MGDDSDLAHNPTQQMRLWRWYPPFLSSTPRYYNHSHIQIRISLNPRRSSVASYTSSVSSHTRSIPSSELPPQPSSASLLTMIVASISAYWYQPHSTCWLCTLDRFGWYRFQGRRTRWSWPALSFVLPSVSTSYVSRRFYRFECGTQAFWWLSIIVGPPASKSTSSRCTSAIVTSSGHQGCCQCLLDLTSSFRKGRSRWAYLCWLKIWALLAFCIWLPTHSILRKFRDISRGHCSTLIVWLTIFRGRCI